MHCASVCRRRRPGLFVLCHPFTQGVKAHADALLRILSFLNELLTAQVFPAMMQGSSLQPQLSAWLKAGTSHVGV